MSTTSNKRCTLYTTLLVAALATMTGCANTGGNSNNSTDGYGYGKKTVKSEAQTPDENKIAAPLSLVEASIGTVVGGGTEQKTLYFFDKDTGIDSTCYDACAAAWPPFLVEDASLATGTLTISNRNDGTQQLSLIHI